MIIPNNVSQRSFAPPKQTIEMQMSYFSLGMVWVAFSKQIWMFFILVKPFIHIYTIYSLHAWPLSTYWEFFPLYSQKFSIVNLCTQSIHGQQDRTILTNANKGYFIQSEKNYGSGRGTNNKMRWWMFIKCKSVFFSVLKIF